MNVTNRTTQLMASSRVVTWLQAGLGVVCLWGMTSQADVLEDLQTALEASNLPIESIADSEVPGLFSLKLTDGTDRKSVV